MEPTKIRVEEAVRNHNTQLQRFTELLMINVNDSREQVPSVLRETSLAGDAPAALPAASCTAAAVPVAAPAQQAQQGSGKAAGEEQPEQEEAAADGTALWAQFSPLRLAPAAGSESTAVGEAACSPKAPETVPGAANSAAHEAAAGEDGTSCGQQLWQR